MNFGVTFETKCYEKDWKYLLQTDRLQKAVSYHQYPFSEIILYINNVNNVQEVTFFADKLVEQGVLTSYVVVDQFADEALKFFKIDKSSFLGGYYYSIAELVSIYRCRTPYLLHFSGDSILESPFSWINEAIARMELDRSIKVANPVWNRRYDEARFEAESEDELFYIGYGFSDQCYLVNAKDFKFASYHEIHPASQRYPVYGGELFEKRVDAWMRNKGFKRLTYKYGSYIHPR
ncbi:hypothetical protein [Paenibacillus alvei]|uniref:hypothetical protein n=1 Tax=Paenibacillus alvei TaxID=44250 RepID=UPI0013DA2BF5|nr:hypothetical protein [Paenibacillus alvei]NEZ45389.1 hypothetical protein [Paenibacillus alvei]